MFVQKGEFSGATSLNHRRIIWNDPKTNVFVLIGKLRSRGVFWAFTELKKLAKYQTYDHLKVDYNFGTSSLNHRRIIWNDPKTKVFVLIGKLRSRGVFWAFTELKKLAKYQSYDHLKVA